MTEKVQGLLVTFRSLTEAERIKARADARNNLLARVGSEPRREEFSADEYSEYPRWLMALIVLLLVLLLVATNGVSALRIYAATRQHFLETLPGHEHWAEFAALSAPLMAEIAMTVMHMAAAVLLKGPQRRWAYMLAGLAVVFAFVANATVTEPVVFELSTLKAAPAFVLLEAVTPPLFAVGVAWLLGHVALAAVSSRHAATQAYRKAREQWQAQVADIEEHADFQRAYMLALWERIAKANARRKTARRALEDADTAGPDALASLKLALVRRELKADAWLSGADGQPDTGRTTGQADNVRTPDSRTPDGQPDKRTTGHAGQPDKPDGQERTVREEVSAWCIENPDLALTVTARSLAAQIGRGKSAVGEALKEWRVQYAHVSGNGHGKHEID